jgi:hypothetical protein
MTGSNEGAVRVWEAGVHVCMHMCVYMNMYYMHTYMVTILHTQMHAWCNYMYVFSAYLL